ncbi:hypothetical protein RO3G_04889 [Rhizopus delemar RA 99-880]|uniref:Uncharacterized protein n=1 Tax=Rhizopus delemar (strain RA 99-880 / ATCC MYA-4621 / FGSC 9543 / NRRL 43880) TaxID=246409 RepID=I1BVF4_RHIO9|nr:hypothetical protein RO3G_04889 [Rhizopus delemar RA 99-880]|eukprot:EIE80184.1 hypothetical protein RO3G_04889 [Rhizopus delemar RA 99-880]
MHLSRIAFQCITSNKTQIFLFTSMRPIQAGKQSYSSKILEQGRRNVINTTSGPSNTDPRFMQQIECASDLQSHFGNTEYISRSSQSTETTSVRMVLTNEMVQIPPVQVDSLEIPDKHICSETQQEIESRSTSSGCIQPAVAEERTLFEPTMEANSKSVEENTGLSQRSDSDHTIVANPILVESPTEDETTLNTGSNANQ